MKIGNTKRKTATLLLILILPALLLMAVSCGGQSQTSPCKKDGFPVTEEQFVAEVKSIYEDLGKELKTVKLYSPPLADNEVVQEQREEEQRRKETGDAEAWKQLYGEKKTQYWNLYNIYGNTLDRLAGLVPSEDYLKAYINLCFVIEMLWSQTYSEFSIYDMCLQEGIRDYEWDSHKDNPRYQIWEGLVQHMWDETSTLCNISPRGGGDGGAGWQEVVDKFDFIDYGALVETS